MYATGCGINKLRFIQEPPKATENALLQELQRKFTELQEINAAQNDIIKDQRRTITRQQVQRASNEQQVDELQAQVGELEEQVAALQPGNNLNNARGGRVGIVNAPTCGSGYCGRPLQLTQCGTHNNKSHGYWLFWRCPVHKWQYWAFPYTADGGEVAIGSYDILLLLFVVHMQL